MEFFQPLTLHLCNFSCLTEWQLWIKCSKGLLETLKMTLSDVREWMPGEVGTCNSAESISMVLNAHLIKLVYSQNIFKNLPCVLIITNKYCGNEMSVAMTTSVFNPFKSENQSWANRDDKVIMNTYWIKSAVWISVSLIANYFCAQLHWIYPSSLPNSLTEISPLVRSWLLWALRGSLTHTKTHVV